MSYRAERLNNLIQEEVSKLLHEEVEFRLDTLVTVTNAQVSINTAHAKVYISVLPKNKTGNVFKILKKNIHYLQQILNNNMRIRPVPKIEFELDKSIDKFEHIEKLIEEIEKEEK